MDAAADAAAADADRDAGLAVQAAAARTAAELPGTERCFPFGPEHEVFKVGGKVFLMATEVTGPPMVTLKCDPEHARALRAEFTSIRPGWHVNKKHWVSVTAGPGVDAGLVDELVTESYLLVRERLPVRSRPALPDHLLPDHLMPTRPTGGGSDD